MAHIANTAFEVKVSNISRNNTQNVAGAFFTYADSTYTPEICPAGFLCVESALMANKGYEGKGASGADILNGNTWKFLGASNGAAGSLGDHTGIYAFNSYDVNKVSSVDGNVYNLGGNTLGLELPAGEIGDFTEIIIGEQYKFGKGNFSTLPASASAIYCTISSGRLVASTSAPSADTGLYFKILRTEPFSKGVRSAFDGYIVKACRA